MPYYELLNPGEPVNGERYRQQRINLNDRQMLEIRDRIESVKTFFFMLYKAKNHVETSTEEC